MRSLVTVLVLVPIGFAALLFVARQHGGEVATLHTSDVAGRHFENSVWVAEDGRDLWIRAERPTSQWLDRVVNQPIVELERGGRRERYRAIPSAHRRSHVNALMAQRYGWADWLVGLVQDRGDALPVRLEVTFD